MGSVVDHKAMKAYSEDLRQKVVEAVEQRGTSKSEAARLFGISLSSVKRYTRRVRELIEGRGCELIYLPPYSPDLNPIEEAFSKMKNLLRKAEARGREALLEAIGAAISAVTDQDARGFFEHCGYRVLDQAF
jgi:transposase